ncbi:UPF0104 family protein [Methylocella sp.]|uniref:UPF0104 family protein n=1 Tax=Methylocella sp. TaxID=1978226 RepID=UPI003784E5FF
MKRLLDFVWPVVGVAAVVVSLVMLYQEFRGQNLWPGLWRAFSSISPAHWALAIASTLVAYAALAWYDKIALRHLGVSNVSWLFAGLCSFTTYALAHNIGATVFSGAMVRYRAYSAKGLSAAQVAVLVALCSFTFALGSMFLGGLLLVYEPQLLSRFSGFLPGLLTNPTTAFVVGLGLLAFVALYNVGSVLRLKPLVLRGFRLEYPRPDIALRQMIAAPLELLGAAGIIYFALPEAANPGFFVVLGVFLASFSAALVSNAPGGLGVFEILFIKAMPATPQVEVLTALLVFRLLYLIIPLMISLVIVVAFEKSRLRETLAHERPELAQETRGDAGASAAAREKIEGRGADAV